MPTRNKSKSVKKTTRNTNKKSRAVKVSREPGRPRHSPLRTANMHLIRTKMIEPVKNGKPEITYVEIVDRITALTGRRFSPDYIIRTIQGERNNFELQKAIARVLGMRLDEAFPKVKEKEQ